MESCWSWFEDKKASWPTHQLHVFFFWNSIPGVGEAGEVVEVLQDLPWRRNDIHAMPFPGLLASNNSEHHVVFLDKCNINRNEASLDVVLIWTGFDSGRDPMDEPPASPGQAVPMSSLERDPSVARSAASSRVQRHCASGLFGEAPKSVREAASSWANGNAVEDSVESGEIRTESGFNENSGRFAR